MAVFATTAGAANICGSVNASIRFFPCRASAQPPPRRGEEKEKKEKRTPDVSAWGQ